MNDDYEFHPEASIDLEDIWEFIANENPAAANRVVADIPDRIEKLVSFPHQGHRRPDLTSRPCDSQTRGITWLFMRRTKSRCGLWQ